MGKSNKKKRPQTEEPRPNTDHPPMKPEPAKPEPQTAEKEASAEPLASDSVFVVSLEESAEEAMTAVDEAEEDAPAIAKELREVEELSALLFEKEPSEREKPSPDFARETPPLETLFPEEELILVPERHKMPLPVSETESSEKAAEKAQAEESGGEAEKSGKVKRKEKAEKPAKLPKRAKQAQPVDEGSLPYLIRLALVLTLISVAVAALLAVVNYFTKDVIEENAVKDREAALLAVFPEGDSFREYVTDEGVPVYFAAAADGQVLGYCVNVASSGYKEEIEMMVGIHPDGSVAGLKIVKMSETPGIGSKVNSDSFLSQFIGKTKEPPLALGETVDGISGATFSSRGVTNGVAQALSVTFDLAEAASSMGLAVLNGETPMETADANEGNGSEALMPGKVGELDENGEPVAVETKPEETESETTEETEPETTEETEPETEDVGAAVVVPPQVDEAAETDETEPETTPPETMPPETTPPETTPPETTPPETTPPETTPPETTPPETTPPETTPPETTPPETTPPETTNPETTNPETTPPETTPPETTEPAESETEQPDGGRLPNYGHIIR